MKSKQHRAVCAAVNTYAAHIGELERKEPRDWQARDLITDLLRMFEPDTARQILANVETFLDEETEMTPVWLDL